MIRLDAGGQRRSSYETVSRYVRELASLAPWPTQWWECWRQSVTNIGRYKITGQPALITAVSHRRMPYFENLVGQVAPQALPDLRKYPIWKYIQFLFRSDWPFFWPEVALIWNIHLDRIYRIIRIVWFSMAISCPSCLPGPSVFAKTGWSCQASGGADSELMTDSTSGFLSENGKSDKTDESANFTEPR